MCNWASLAEASCSSGRCDRDPACRAMVCGLAVLLKVEDAEATLARAVDNYATADFGVQDGEAGERNEEYARHIAEKWNVKESGSGYVTRFAVREELIARYPVQQVGARLHTEHWIPAEELPELNRNIVGLIEVIASFERT